MEMELQQLSKPKLLAEIHVLSKGVLDSNMGGSKLAVFNENTEVRKTGGNGNGQSFVRIIPIDGHSVKIIRQDDTHDDFSDQIGFKNPHKIQSGISMSVAVGSDGNMSKGSFSPSDPRFPPITKGESITVRFTNGRVSFTPSTCSTTFTTDIPQDLVFGLAIYGQHHSWKLERW
ncbi:hypothetical protein GEMRC1_011381 [Eukaryota sp. GEM-RC1]